ncbi:MAG: riboflavin synthase [Planctomycetota bacterium]|nr:riboflavin synthase [Planctomycetota bacterium]
MAASASFLKMFTGIVEGTAEVREFARVPEGARLSVDLGPLSSGVMPGDSILVDGCCLTAESIDGSIARFSAVSETLSLTTLGGLQAGRSVNVERSLRVGDRLGGHFVYGHIDGVGEVLKVTEAPASLKVRVPAALSRYLVPKGSIAVDGVSLTLAEVEGDVFSVALVPFTLERTTLRKRRAGDQVNIETDYLARIVLHDSRNS